MACGEGLSSIVCALCDSLSRDRQHQQHQQRLQTRRVEKERQGCGELFFSHYSSPFFLSLVSSFWRLLFFFVFLAESEEAFFSSTFSVFEP